MLGSGKTGAVRAFVAASPARSQDTDLYRHYAAGLYRQALLTRGDPALAEHVVYDVIVNERALARMPLPRTTARQEGLLQAASDSGGGRSGR